MTFRVRCDRTVGMTGQFDQPVTRRPRGICLTLARKVADVLGQRPEAALGLGAFSAFTRAEIAMVETMIGDEVFSLAEYVSLNIKTDNSRTLAAR
jgi:hypothetical protein